MNKLTQLQLAALACSSVDLNKEQAQALVRAMESLGAQHLLAGGSIGSVYGVIFLKRVKKRRHHNINTYSFEIRDSHMTIKFKANKILKRRLERT